VIEHEAEVVRMVFDAYTRDGLSINTIARLLNQRHVPTRYGAWRWERSTVWGMLRNPAYRGKACYGKTELRPRQRITRPVRLRNGVTTRGSANHERPRQEWIEIAVPALVSDETFELAQEQLEKNCRVASRRTIRPSVLQGLLVCQQCSYGMYRTDAHFQAHALLLSLPRFRCLSASVRSAVQ
jgi:site-specific DNA recombinase